MMASGNGQRSAMPTGTPSGGKKNATTSWVALNDNNHQRRMEEYQFPG